MKYFQFKFTLTKFLSQKFNNVIFFLQWPLLSKTCYPNKITILYDIKKSRYFINHGILNDCRIELSLCIKFHYTDNDTSDNCIPLKTNLSRCYHGNWQEFTTANRAQQFSFSFSIFNYHFEISETHSSARYSIRLSLLLKPVFLSIQSIFLHEQRYWHKSIRNFNPLKQRAEIAALIFPAYFPPSGGRNNLNSFHRETRVVWGY